MSTSFDEFASFWEKKIQVIEETPIHPDQLMMLWDDFYAGSNLFVMLTSLDTRRSNTEKSESADKTRSLLLQHKLSVAIHLSASRWKEKHPGLIDKLISNTTIHLEPHLIKTG